MTKKVGYGTGCEAYGIVIAHDCQACPLPICRYDEIRKEGEVFGGQADGEKALNDYLYAAHGISVAAAFLSNGSDLRAHDAIATLALEEGILPGAIRTRAHGGYPGTKYDVIRDIQEQVGKTAKHKANAIKMLALRDGISMRGVHRRLAAGVYQIGPNGEIYGQPRTRARRGNSH